MKMCFIPSAGGVALLVTVIECEMINFSVRMGSTVDVRVWWASSSCGPSGGRSRGLSTLGLVDLGTLTGVSRLRKCPVVVKLLSV